MKFQRVLFPSGLVWTRVRTPEVFPILEVEHSESLALAGGFLLSLLGFKAESGMIYAMAVIGAIGVAWIYRKVSAKPAREEMLPTRKGREGGLNEG